MSIVDAETSALPCEHSEAPAGQTDQLKLINVGPSADGAHVDVHFLTSANRVTSVHLDITVATGLYNLLGDTIARVKTELQRIRPMRLN